MFSRWLLALVLLAAPLAAQDGGSTYDRHAYREVEIAGERYVVSYRYGDGLWTIDTNTPTVHFVARVSVYFYQGSHQVQLAPEFGGLYDPEGCFDADPEQHARYALKVFWARVAMLVGRVV